MFPLRYSRAQAGVVSIALTALPIVSVPDVVHGSAAPAAPSSEFARSQVALKRPIPPGDEGGVAGSACGPAVITQSTDPASIELRNTISCVNQLPPFFTYETSVARVFTAPAAAELRCLQFGIETNSGGATSVEVTVFLGNIVTSPSIPHATQVVVPVSNNVEQQLLSIDLPSGIIVSAGDAISIQLRTPNRDPQAGGDGGQIFLGSNDNGETAPSYVSAVACGVPEYVSFAAIGFPGVQVVMSLGIDVPAYKVFEQLPDFKSAESSVVNGARYTDDFVIARPGFMGVPTFTYYLVGPPGITTMEFSADKLLDDRGQPGPVMASIFYAKAALVDYGPVTFPGIPDAHAYSADVGWNTIDNDGGGFWIAPSFTPESLLWVTAGAGFVNGSPSYFHPAGSMEWVPASAGPLGYSTDFAFAISVHCHLDPTCPFDVNSDGTVDGGDLGLMLVAWDTNTVCVDLNGDQVVNGADLGLLLGAWGACRP